MKEALLETVAKQIEGEEAPEVRAEYERLRREGVADGHAREAMALVLGGHVVRMLKKEATFDYEAYLDDLRHLPHGGGREKEPSGSTG